MGPLGFPELIIIFVVALVLFGPRKLPELGRSLGKSLAEFKRASNELRNTLDDEIRAEERKTTSLPPAPVQPVQPQNTVHPDPHELVSPTDPANLSSPAAPETIARGALLAHEEEEAEAVSRGERGT